MIEFSIHLPSVFIGFLTGYMIVAALWIYETCHDSGDFSRGWEAGYECGKRAGRNEIVREMKGKGKQDEEYFVRSE